MLALALAALLAASPPPPSDGLARIEALLTPTLRAVLRPAPVLVDETRAARLAWVATLGRRVDARLRLSDSAAWRAIMAWPMGDDAEAADTSGDRYPVPAGRTDPATDFAASVALAWLDGHELACRFPLRARFLRDHDLAPQPNDLDAGRCGAFERWARLDLVDGIEVIYVTQKWSDAAATMGHVVFRVRLKDGGVVAGPSASLVFSYVAKDPTDTPGYMLKGMTGGLTAGVKLEGFGDTFARYGLEEGRDMQVYDLRLDADERRYLLAEVFAQARGEMQVPYAFFTTNCATMAYDSLRAVLPELPEHAGFLVHPHEVVSLLLAAGRAVPRGIVPARSTRGARGEADREDDVRALRGPNERPELARVHEARWASLDERAAALRALEAALAARPPAAEEARALARYVDDILDIEAFAVDRAAPRHDEHATSPALEAALSLRAGLPRGEAEPDPEPFDSAPIGRSGSRHVGLAATYRDGRATATWTTAVLHEEAGEARVVGLRRASRMRLVENVLALSTDGRDLAVEEERLTLVDTASWGAGFRTDASWLSAHLGFAFAVETWSRPRDGLSFAVSVRGGPGLTLVAARDFGSHLVVASETALESFSGVGRDAAFRASTGLALEAALALGSPLARLRARGRVAPAVDLGGLRWEAEARLALDATIAPEDGIFLQFFGAWATGRPSGDGWSAGVGVAF